MSALASPDSDPPAVVKDLQGAIQEPKRMKQLSDETADAIRKVHELGVLREEYIRKRGVPLSFRSACRKIGIYPITLMRLAPELYENWKDITFHWQISDK